MIYYTRKELNYLLNGLVNLKFFINYQRDKEATR